MTSDTKPRQALCHIFGDSAACGQELIQSLQKLHLKNQKVVVYEISEQALG